MKNIFTFLIMTLLLGFSTISDAQTWQWGKRGGSPTDGGNNLPKEDVVAMETDQNGNLYALCTYQGSLGPDIDGHPLSTHANRDIVLASFKCNGMLRWTRVIGGGQADRPIAMGIDTLGHIYLTVLTGYTSNPGEEVSFSGDTTLSLSTNKLISLVQYDTSGNFGWLRQPTPDTARLGSNPYVYDLHVEKNGDVYWAMLMAPGLVSGTNGWAVPTLGPYILKYNKNGDYTGNVKLDMFADARTTFDFIRFNRMSNGDFVFGGIYDYLIGTTRPVFGSDTLTTTCFLTKFSPNGQNLWFKQNRLLTYYEGIQSQIIFDDQENIYFSGDCTGGDDFNGYTYSNWLGTSNVPFISKTDKNGNLIWTKNASGYYGHDVNSISLKNNYQFIVSGSGNSVWWDSLHKVQILPNGGLPVYTTTFDAAGNVLAMDSTSGSFGTEVYANSQTIDKKGNLYIGGNFTSDLIVAGNRMIKAGGLSDFFIAKFGNNCNCTLPTCTYTGVKTANTVRFTYTGSSNIDSLWLFYGDGQKTSLRSGFSTPITHNYGNVGKVTACLTVWNSCGSNSYCQDYTMPTAISEPASVKLAKVYPNPATSYLTIEGLEGGHATMSNNLGQVVKDFAITDYRTLTDMRELPTGIYFLELRDAKGNREVVKVVR